ncbi:hypothetical protein MKX08_007910 [Trichoderma sp. CBMAI-0020]|nr:hypothetical protein MKX08_007910 [Trichoderma sp. CBMAI-0020]
MAELKTTTHVYKTVNGLELTIDVSTPATAQGNVALIHFHGGFLLFGDKTSFAPYWLINVCKKRGWTYATASYRLLPEAGGHDILEDSLDAVRWIYNNISRRIILAGSSAGGHVAFTTAASPLCPKPLALLFVSGMIDFLNGRYVHPGRLLRGGISNEAELLKEIDVAIQGAKVIDGYPIPPDLEKSQRFKWSSAMHQAARYIDVLTHSPGLTEKVAKEGIQAIPEEHRPLFPATFGLNANFPPTVLIHGDADDLVDFEVSSSVATKLQNAGLDVHFKRAVGQGHGFDAAENIDLDAENNGEDRDGTREILKWVVELLERYTREN